MRQKEYNRDIALHVQLLAIVMATGALLGTFAMLAGSALLIPAALGLPFIDLQLPEPLQVSLLGILGLVLILAVGNLALGVGGAFGLQRRRPWGRLLGLIDCGISLFLFPFGTLYGVYGLWVLLPEDAEEYVGCCEKPAL